MNDEYQQYVDELIEWLSIPSISGDVAYREDMERASEWLVKRLEKLGFEARTMDPPTLKLRKGKEPLPPVVYGERRVKSPSQRRAQQELRDKKPTPTILIYGHYDVQSPDPVEEWESDPFNPEIRNTPTTTKRGAPLGEGSYPALYARGVADDKGQLYTWIAALDQLLVEGRDFPVNIKFLVEGAEEEGSEGLAEFVAEHKDLLQADVCVLSDTHCLSPSQPLITYGLRGLVYFEVTLETLKQDAHSGIYGGNVGNAAQELALIISRLKTDDKQISIPGFYDDVRKLSDSEYKELADFPWDKSDIKTEVGAKQLVGETDFSIAVRAGARPTLDVNGLWGGFQGEGGKTIIPAKASAKISMRLVPHQDPADIAKKFEKYVKTLVPNYATVTINQLHSAEPVLLERDSRYFKTAEDAYEKVFGNKPLYELSGGSIGVVADFKKILGIDSVMMGYGLPDDGLHSPNEKMSLEMFEKGIETNLAFLRLLRKASRKR